jgi:LysM repeat protein
MQTKSRAVIFAAFCVAPLMLAAGCGDSAGSSSGGLLSPIQPSSYVTIEPATTTTTTTIFIDPGQPVGPTISPDPQTYIVVAGDSLSKIASLFDMSVDELITYNAWTDGTNHLLLAGDEILIPPNKPIPGSGTPGTPGATTTAPSDQPDGAGCSHTVVAGDNPTRVAKKYDITVDQLSNANLDNPAYNTFLIGSQLTIPPEGNC